MSEKKKPDATKRGRDRQADQQQRAVSASPGPNPITLAEARELAAQALQPSTARALARATIVPVSHAGHGEERQRLISQQREERIRRVRDYTHMITIMKNHGARRGPAPARNDAAVSGRGTIVQGFRPLQIFAEGDSWFDYPVPFFGGGIIPRLEDLIGVPILNLAQAGDEVRYMLGVEQRKIIVQHLQAGCPAGDPWDVMLFSGGGNDIVGNPMALWVKDWRNGTPLQGAIDEKRFGAALELVRSGYEDLIALRDKLSPDTHLVFHGYDFAIPDGRGICGYGPWLKPTFDLRGFPNLAQGQQVVKAMLQEFAQVLRSLAGTKITVVGTQGTLTPAPAAWHNELHPAADGFQKFAGLFQAKIKALFPANVL